MFRTVTTLPAPAAAVVLPAEVPAVVLEDEPELVAGALVEPVVCAGAEAVELDPAPLDAVPLDGVPDVVAAEPVPDVSPVVVVVEVVPVDVPEVEEPVVVAGPLVPVAPGVPARSRSGSGWACSSSRVRWAGVRRAGVQQAGVRGGRSQRRALSRRQVGVLKVVGVERLGDRERLV